MSNMKTTYLGSVIVPNGYSGDNCKVFLCYDLDSQKTLAVHPGGFFTSSVPPACDSKEATWLVQNHPACDNMSDFTPLVVESKKDGVRTSKKRTFTFYEDPGHGWMKVPRKLLVALGVECQISTCSYQRGDFVYLEEDSDAGIVLDLLKEQGVALVLKSSHTDRSSRIRSYDSYVVRKKVDSSTATEDAHKLWSQLGDIPINDDEETEESFLHFEVGTDREDIWHWFEERFNISVTELMYGTATH